MTAFTIIDGSRATEVDAEVSGDRVVVADADLERATGWAVKPEGLCRGEICVPLRDGAGTAGAGRVDLGEVAAALRRPLAVDTGESAAALGASAGERAERLSSLEAPDFALLDLEGRSHSLSSHRGRKVLLVVYASW